MAKLKFNSVGVKSLYSDCGVFCGTVTKIEKRDDDSSLGQYRFSIYGGVAHGKFSYCPDYGSVRVKAEEVVRLCLAS